MSSASSTFPFTLKQAVSLLAAAGVHVSELEATMLLEQVGVSMEAGPQGKTGALSSATRLKPSGHAPQTSISTSLFGFKQTPTSKAPSRSHTLQRYQAPQDPASSSNVSQNSTIGVRYSTAMSAVGATTSQAIPTVPQVASSSSRRKSEDDQLAEHLQRSCQIHPSPPTTPSPIRKSKKKRGPWYAVIVGERVGVFFGWLLAGPYVIGYSGNIFDSFMSQQDALNHFWSNYPHNVKSGSGIVEGVEGLVRIAQA